MMGITGFNILDCADLDESARSSVEAPVRKLRRRPRCNRPPLPGMSPTYDSTTWSIGRSSKTGLPCAASTGLSMSILSMFRTNHEPNLDLRA
jgi:hypothetical protein